MFLCGVPKYCGMGDEFEFRGCFLCFFMLV
jgi:hypothetical protein